MSSYLVYIPTFVKVVEEQSFSAAARELGMTKSAVSKHIQALEDGLNARLLNRTTRTLSLTEEGKTFYERCTQIVEELAEAERAVQNLNENPSGVMRINAPESFGELHLAPVLTAFAAAYPDIHLEIDFTNRFINITEEGVDVAIRVASLTDSSLIARKLAPCQMALVASPDYLKQRGTPKHPDELINHCFIEYAYLERLREWRYMAPDGQPGVAPICVRLRSNNTQMLVQSALDGLGLLSAPTFITGPHIKAGKLKVVMPEYQIYPERSIYALFPHNRFMATKVRLFVDFMVKHFQGTPSWEI